MNKDKDDTDDLDNVIECISPVDLTVASYRSPSPPQFKLSDNNNNNNNTNDNTTITNNNNDDDDDQLKYRPDTPLEWKSYQSRESLVSCLSSYRETPSVTGCSSSSAAGRQRASPPTPPPQAAPASSLPADVPSGLVNLGNTCYMNATLQALYSIEALRNQIISSSCNIGGGGGGGGGSGSTTTSLSGSTSNISACSGSSMAMGNKVLTRQLGDLFKKMKESSSLAAGAAAAASSSPSSPYRYSTSGTSGGAPPVNPHRFKFAFAEYQGKFSGFGQQDAQEFLRYLINGVHEESNLAPKRQRRGAAAATTSRPAPKTSQEAWSQYRDIVDDSPLVDLLVGQLCSTITCGQCQNKSHCWDPFWDLSLPLAMRKHGTTNTASIASARTTSAASTLASSFSSIGSGSSSCCYTSGARYTYGTVSCSLLDVINEFTSIETLDSDERPICSACKKATPATKQISLARLPQVLILHLKKFTNDGYKLTSPDITIDKQLTFNGVRYKLKACIEHHGHSSATGHYTSHCQYSTRWFHFNDGSVSDVTSSFDSKKLDDAYVLFYTQTNSTCSISQSKL